MATFAGTMFSGAQADPQWVPADGKPYFVNDPKQPRRAPIPGTPSTGDRRDYCRRTGYQGRRLGMGWWIIQMPINSGWVVSTADDWSEGAIASPPTVQYPPAGTK